jgi:hypothetical protein
MILPLVTWRERKWNGLADAWANMAMDGQRDYEWQHPLAAELVQGDDALFQWHSDGGTRDGLSGAVAYTLLRISIDATGTPHRILIFARALFYSSKCTAFQTETSALELAMQAALKVWERNQE